jgi:hypothetical protein
MMLNMMTPDMMRMSMKFAQENPDMVKQQLGAKAPPAQNPTAAASAFEPDQIDSTQTR